MIECRGVASENVDNLSVVRCPAISIEQSIIEVEAILKKEKEKASATSACQDLKSLYSPEMIAKPYPSEYMIPKFDDRKGISRTRGVQPRFNGPFVHDSNFCLREFSKSLNY